MGGLAALFLERGARVDPRLFHRICTAVPCRVSEGLQTWGGEGAAIARLVSVAADEPASPIAEQDDLVLAFDGRLDEREALAATLSLPAGATDASLALAAVRRWDVQAPAHLLGDFAFIAWDCRRRRALLGRDHMGIRPLHFTLRDGTLVCGTDITHLLADPAVPRRPNVRVAAEYLSCAIRNGSDTLFDGISRVPPAHVVVVEQGRRRAHRYWSAVPAQRVWLPADDDYADRCRELLDRSVEARLRSAAPVCATLSGGVDSSVVALTAHRLRPAAARPTLFSMVFPGHPEADERAYIDAVAARCGAAPVFVTPADTGGTLRARAATWMNAPSTAVDATWERMWTEMRARGYRTALTGAGGDFAFAGSLYHHADLIRRGRLLALIARYRDDCRADDTGMRPLSWVQAGLWPALPVMVKRTLRPLARRAAARLGIVRRRPWLRLPFVAEEYPDEPRGGSFAVEELVRTLTDGLHAFVLEGAERATAEAGITLRHPLLDVRLTEFVLAIPEEQRRRGPILKYVLRRALRDELPALVAERRTKGDFSHCVTDVLERLGGESFFGALRIADAGWVDRDDVVELYRLVRADAARGSARTGLFIPDVWMIAAVELWFRAAFAGEPLPDAIMAAPTGG